MTNTDGGNKQTITLNNVNDNAVENINRPQKVVETLIEHKEINAVKIDEDIIKENISEKDNKEDIEKLLEINDDDDEIGIIETNKELFDFNKRKEDNLYIFMYFDLLIF